MKLLTKTTLFFLTIALFVLFVGGIVFYFLFRYMVNREVRNELVTEMHQIILHPPHPNEVGSDSVFFDLPVHYQIIPIKKIENRRFAFNDTLLYDNIMQRYQSYRMLSFETQLTGKPVRISITKSLLISDELIEYVAFVTLLLSLILLLCIFAFNSYFFKSIWGNFFKTIDVIKDYNISDTREIRLPDSEITEFNMLNQVFERMHRRIRQDYQNLKEFIENISHEIQTPLAIIKSKADLLQQGEHLDDDQVALIGSIQGNIRRLSNLNKSLILLSKIDNNQFSEREEVNLAEIIQVHLENFGDIIRSKEITLLTGLQDPIVVWADPNLISIMLLNLLKNSIYHNISPGKVEVGTGAGVLTVRNTGKKLTIEREDLFKRFTKSSDKPDSLGLGLAIVKKICDYYQYRISYDYDGTWHTISIAFI